MLLLVVVLFLIFRHRGCYGYGPYWSQPYYRGDGYDRRFGLYGPAAYGYTWNGYTWVPGYGAGGASHGHPYGFYRRPCFW